MLVTLIGSYGDAWWHIVVGRETFWTPPHVVLYAGITLMLLSVLLLTAHVLGYQGQGIGNRVKIALSAGLATMLGSAPLDDWWHATFGPDQTPWTPPHLMATAGFVFLLAVSLPVFVRRSTLVMKVVYGLSLTIFIILIATVEVLA